MHLDCGGDVVVDAVGADDVDGTVALQHVQHIGFHAGEVDVDVLVPAGLGDLLRGDEE